MGLRSITSWKYHLCSTQIPSITRSLGVFIIVIAGRVNLIDVILVYVLVERYVVYGCFGSIPRYMR